MRKLKNSYVRIAIILLMVLSLAGPSFNASASPRASHPPINLGTTANFAVLAGSDVNDTTPSTVIGDVGLDPATGANIDVTCAEVTGTIYDNDAAYPGLCEVTNAALLTTAKNDLTTAYNDADNTIPTTNLPGADNQLGGQTLTDGTYNFGGATTANLIGTLTLDGQGDPNSVFIFQASSTLVTASSSVVSLINGAQACNVFWQVSTSATFGTATTFVGTVMADQSITDDGGATINGRLLARIAAVTLNNTTITRSDCAAAPPEEEEEEEDVVTGLPDTGGAPIRNEDLTWIPLIVGGFSVAALALGIRAYRRTQLPKQ